MNTFIHALDTGFALTVEVVPPKGNDPQLLLDTLCGLSSLPFHGFSVATNPIAKPCMSAMAMSKMIQDHTLKPATFHCTPRDENLLGLQSTLWGAKAMGIQSVLVVSGDPSTQLNSTRVDDVSVFELIRLSKESGLHTGAVFDFRPEVDGFDHEVHRLGLKKEAGASFIVTQPVYDEVTAQKIHQVAIQLKIPVVMGILPLISEKHARFLHEKVDGISIPNHLIKRIKTAENPLNEGINQAKVLLDISRNLFSGACIMPPFDRFGILSKILEPL